MNEEIWLKMLKDRNNTAHIYDENAAKRDVNFLLEKIKRVFKCAKEVI